MTDFKKELAEVINRHSKENGSDTPDFMLANFLSASLEAFDTAVKWRTQWYGGDKPTETTPIPIAWEVMKDRYIKESGGFGPLENGVFNFLEKQPEFTDTKCISPCYERLQKLYALADILSRVFYYGDFKIETPNERTIAGLLFELNLFPCSEEELIKRPVYEEYFQKFKGYRLPDNGGKN